MHKTPYVNGKIHGVVFFYYESGAIAVTAPYVNGLRHGVERFYDESGEQTERKIFAEGVQIS